MFTNRIVLWLGGAAAGRGGRAAALASVPSSLADSPATMRPQRSTSRPVRRTSSTCSRRAASAATWPCTACRRGACSQQSPVFSQYPGEGLRLQRADEGAAATRATASSRGTMRTIRRCRRPTGSPDGRWLFINGNNTPRIARLDLTTMETAEILEIPNSAGNHASPFVTANSEYVVGATRFSVPTPQADVPIATAKENFAGLLSFVKVEPEGRHVAGVPDSAPRLQLRPRAFGQGAVERTGRSSPPTTPSRRSRSSSAARPSATRTSSPR